MVKEFERILAKGHNGERFHVACNGRICDIRSIGCDAAELKVDGWFVQIFPDDPKTYSNRLHMFLDGNNYSEAWEGIVDVSDPGRIKWVTNYETPRYSLHDTV